MKIFIQREKIMFSYIILNTLIIINSIFFKIKRNKVFFLANIIILFIFFAGRFDVGNDYKIYYLVGEKSLKLNYKLHYEIFEVGSKILYSITWLFENPQIYIIGSSLVIFIGLYFSLRNYRYKIESLLIYMCFPFFFNHLSIIRQSMAEIVVLVSLKYIKNNERKFIFLIFLSSLFHKSSIVALIYLPLKYINLNKIQLVLISNFYFFKYILSKILVYTPYQKYIKHTVSLNAGGTKIIILYQLLNFLIILNKDKLIKKSKDMNMFINSFAIGGLIYSTMPNLHGMRLSEYFFLGYILIVPVFISLWNNYIKIISYLCICMLFLALLYVGKENLIPYKNYFFQYEYNFRE